MTVGRPADWVPIVSLTGMHVSLRTLRRWCLQGKIACKKRKGHYYVNVRKLKVLLDAYESKSNSFEATFST